MTTTLAGQVVKGRPINKRHLDHVLNVNGYAFVDPKEVPNLTLRYTESYIRRRLIRIEDETQGRVYQLGWLAWREIQRHGNELRRGNNRDSWMREMVNISGVIASQLANAVAEYVYLRSALTYQYAYYARSWQLEAMRADGSLRTLSLSPIAASHGVSEMPLLAEVGDEWPPRLVDDDDDEFLWLLFLMNEEWRRQFLNLGAELGIAWRRLIIRGTNQRWPTDWILQQINARMGVMAKRPGEKIGGFIWRFLTLARSYVIESMNRASLEVYEAHPDAVGQVQWVTAQDDRVCVQCQALEGRRWKRGDPNMLRPVEDTHFNCRCTLVPIPPADASAPPDEDRPRTVRFEEWLEARGEQQLLGQLRRTGRI